MRPMAQMAMVMNLDKCIGCHTCSVTCKQVWTNRPGTEYVYFNNVETKPGIGYPKRYEDQEQWHGGWTLDRKGRLQLKAGGRLRKLLSIFYNPDLPTIDDYGDPWTYDYQTLIDAPLGTQNPSAHSISALTGRDMKVSWGSNFDDDLAGAPELAVDDPNLAGLEERVRMEFEQVFMFYLPRICEHCLNPSCVASCPSGAMYKREEDGIVLVDQDRCRGWRFCVSGCPYKKVYFNHRTGKAEKCTLCFPRIEAGQPTICSETCVGRLRYLGLVLYDADAVLEAAATTDVQDLYEAQLSVFLDPEDPEVRAEAARQGMPADWIDAARRSPVYALAAKHRVALPLHPGRCQWSGTSRRCHRSPTSCTPPATTTPTRTTCSPRSTRCGSRSTTWPTCSRPVRPTPSAPCCANSLSCGRSSAPGSSVSTSTTSCRRRSGRASTSSMTSTGCWRSRSTTTAM
jgi:nitrate reductase / nitrite oxidoreductase, beta subunit